MPELTLTFIVSQILMFVAMWTDFLSMQFKNRKYIFGALIISAILISAHYFLLDKTTAGIIVTISVFRFITCYFTTNKKYLYLFLVLNTLALIFSYTEVYDLIIYIGLFVFIIWNFQKDNKKMRLIMMLGTAIVMSYNIFIFSPMWVVAEGSFLLSHMIGYYRYYIRKNKLKNYIIEQ